MKILIKDQWINLNTAEDILSILESEVSMDAAKRAWEILDDVESGYHIAADDRTFQKARRYDRIVNYMQLHYPKLLENICGCEPVKKEEIMPYKNPIPSLDDPQQTTEILLKYTFDSPVTRQEAAESLTELFRTCPQIAEEQVILSGSITRRPIKGEVK